MTDMIEMISVKVTFYDYRSVKGLMMRCYFFGGGTPCSDDIDRATKKNPRTMKVEKIIHEKWRWHSKTMKIWFRYNNIKVFILAKTDFSSSHFSSWYGIWPLQFLNHVYFDEFSNDWTSGKDALRQYSVFATHCKKKKKKRQSKENQTNK